MRELIDAALRDRASGCAEQVTGSLHGEEDEEQVVRKKSEHDGEHGLPLLGSPAHQVEDDGGSKDEEVIGQIRCVQRLGDPELWVHGSKLTARLSTEQHAFPVLDGAVEVVAVPHSHVQYRELAVEKDDEQQWIPVGQDFGGAGKR